MDEGQTRVMCVLAALLGGVTAALWWFDAPGVDADPDAIVPVWIVPDEGIARIEITRADGRLVLASEAGAWSVIEPERFDADPERVRGLLTTLSSIEMGVPLEASDPAEFGLGETPVATVTVTPLEGEPQTLVFGHEARVGWATYARTSGGALVAVPGKPVADLTAGVDHWRDRRILRFDPADVRAVTLQSAQGTLTVRGVEPAEKVAGGPPLTWWLEGYTRADPDIVDDLVSGLLMLRFEEIDARAPPVAEPEVTVRVETTDRPWTLRVGPSDGSFSPAEVEGGATGRVLSDALAILGMGPTDLGDSRAFPYDPDTTDRIEVVAGDERWVAVRNGSAWEVDGAESLPAADVAGAVDGAAIAYTREPVAPSDTVAMSVILGEGARRRQVDVGPPQGELAVARDVAGGAPYRVPEQDLAPLRRVFAP
ncbi:MAG: DUF4340 domain-containing protein [Deltaproteobacteria bacterium]|nr:DUF4340 domain-containing protein [Deltaproteobacteria bacterium]